MSKYPIHDQKEFFKYMKMSTAFKTLEGGCFRFSSPLYFNDPFDIQTELNFDFDLKDLPQLVVEKIDVLVRDMDTKNLDINSNWCKAIFMLKEQHKKGKYRKNHLDFLVKPLIEHLLEKFEDTRIKYNENWLKLLEKIRVFCVTETNSNILMWSHYSKDHTGVCLKLKVLPDEDNPICAAKKIDYPKVPPSYFSLTEWIDSVILDKELDYKNLYNRYPLVKSDIWVYEDEWRVWSIFEENTNHYFDISIVPGEIESIYFGVNADPAAVKLLMNEANKLGINSFFKAQKSSLNMR